MKIITLMFVKFLSYVCHLLVDLGFLLCSRFSIFDKIGEHERLSSAIEH